MKLLQCKLKSTHTLVMLLVLLCCIGTGCTSVRLSGRNRADDYFSGTPHPLVNYSVWHVNDTVTRLYWSIDPKSMLFKAGDKGFQALCEVKAIQYAGYSSSTGSDTVVVIRTYPSDSATSITDSMDVPLMRGQSRIFSLSWRDLNRAVATTVIQQESKNTFGNGDVLLTNAADELLWKPSVSPLRPFCTRTASPTTGWFVKAYFTQYPIAVPPFVNAGIAKFSLKPDSEFVLTPSLNGEYSLPAKGLYLLCRDSLSRDGAVVLSFTDDFPAITLASEMLPPLRYLSTAKEYNDLLAMPSEKAAMDHFWLETGGNKEIARDLIRAFYQRVATANSLFTSYLEGWKTDRGMIYIVFGPPQSVYTSDNDETWWYDYGPNRPDIRFTFRKVNNPFTTNDYSLDRSPIFEQAWYMAVDAWRQGRIFND